MGVNRRNVTCTLSKKQFSNINYITDKGGMHHHNVENIINR